MKYLSLTVAAAAIVALSASMAISQESVLSLRGDNDLAALAETFNKQDVVSRKGGFKRSWKLQPPLISHTIEKDVVDLDGNSCMRCHSAENYKKEDAVKIGDSHFIAADGTKGQTLNGRRYFCSQCHAIQVDAKPLVDNTFDSGGN